MVQLIYLFTIISDWFLWCNISSLTNAIWRIHTKRRLAWKWSHTVRLYFTSLVTWHFKSYLWEPLPVSYICFCWELFPSHLSDLKKIWKKDCCLSCAHSSHFHPWSNRFCRMLYFVCVYITGSKAFSTLSQGLLLVSSQSFLTYPSPPLFIFIHTTLVVVCVF